MHIELLSKNYKISLPINYHYRLFFHIAKWLPLVEKQLSFLIN